jgi:hypothetical protein
MQRPWIYVGNPFLNATERSYKRFLKISQFHVSALNAGKADPFILAMYNLYQDVDNAFVSAYNIWIASEGMRKGSTAGVENLLRQLSGTLARKWDVKVQSVYDQGSPEYVALLPNKRGDFQSKSDDSRIVAVKAFGLRLAGVAPLAALRVEVTDFYNLLESAKGDQQRKTTTTNTNNNQVEHARQAAASVMYQNLAKCIDHFILDLDCLLPYFDVATIRQAQQTEFTGAVTFNGVVNITKHTLEADDEITLENNGAVALVFYASGYDDTKALAASPMFTLQPGEVKTVTAAEMGDSNTSPFINVMNEHALLAGHYKISIN